MTYTREEWEPAATAAAMIPNQWLRSALIKAYIDIAELREQLSAAEAETSRDLGRENSKFEQLSEELAAAEDKHRCLCDSTLKQERDRLRQALEEIQDLDRCVSTFQCRKVAFKALAQPEEKP